MVKVHFRSTFVPQHARLFFSPTAASSLWEAVKGENNRSSVFLSQSQLWISFFRMAKSLSSVDDLSPGWRAGGTPMAFGSPCSCAVTVSESELQSGSKGELNERHSSDATINFPQHTHSLSHPWTAKHSGNVLQIFICTRWKQAGFSLFQKLTDVKAEEPELKSFTCFRFANINKK